MQDTACPLPQGYYNTPDQSDYTRLIKSWALRQDLRTKQ